MIMSTKILNKILENQSSNTLDLIICECHFCEFVYLLKFASNSLIKEKQRESNLLIYTFSVEIQQRTALLSHFSSRTVSKGSFCSMFQFSSVAQSCPTLCDPMNRSMQGLPVHQQLQEFTQIHIQQVGDAIQPSHPLSSPSPPAPNPSQHQSLFQ